MEKKKVAEITNVLCMYWCQQNKIVWVNIYNDAIVNEAILIEYWSLIKSFDAENIRAVLIEMNSCVRINFADFDELELKNNSSPRLLHIFFNATLANRLIIKTFSKHVSH